MEPSSPTSQPIVAFGEVLLRLNSPGAERLLQSARLEAHVGGAELNTLAALSGFGHETRLITTLPQNPLGDAALAVVRSLGIQTGDLRRQPGRMGLYFAERGQGCRAGQVFYDRGGSAFALDDNPRPWPVLLRNTRWLHLTGITPPLGDGPATAAIEAAAAAGRLGVPMSLDVNFRAQLWAVASKPPETLLAPLLKQATVVFASADDLAVMNQRSASHGDTAAGSDSAPDGNAGATPVERYAAATARTLEALPKAQLICSCLRFGDQADSNRLVAAGRDRHGFHVTAERTVSGIVERIGSGDAFAAAVLHMHLQGAGLAQALEFGLAAAALKHSIVGDFSRISLAEIEALRQGRPALLRR